MKVMFLIPYPVEIGSTRQRVFSYIPYLRKEGLQCYISSFVTSKFYKFIYSPGKLFEKMIHTGNGFIRRFNDVSKISGYDLVFVQREAFPFGTTLLEERVSSKKPVIYDFDDAIYLMNPAKSSLVPFLRRPSKIPTIIGLADCVIAGNQYLADYASNFNKNVQIIPTSIDTDHYTPKDQLDRKKRIIIGWIGSRTTIPYLSVIQEALQKIAKKSDVIFKVVANATIDLSIETEFKQWQLSEELNDLRSFDIGLMPLPDNEWTKAKCGYKIIQYMAVGKPVIASPVGANKEIINDGINGFLAQGTNEWTEKLLALIESSSLRKKIGEKGRKTAVERYSIKANAPKVLNIIRKYKPR